MTRLEAVNYILTRCGRRAATALDTDGASSTADAERCLDDAEWEVQSEGWKYNTRQDVDLSPDGSGKIAIPEGVFNIETSGGSNDLDLIQNGDFLYDQKNNTDVFTDAVTVTYTLRMAWCYIPPSVRRYIAALGAERFNQQYNSPDVFWRRRIDLQNGIERARLVAMRDDEDTRKANILQSSDAIAVKARTRFGTLGRDENLA